MNSAGDGSGSDDVKLLLKSWYTNDDCGADDHDDGYGTGDK